MISGGQILWNAIATCECSRPPGRRENSVWTKICGILQGDYLPSSYWTESSVIRAERRAIPCSTEVHWCHQVNQLTPIWTLHRKDELMTIGMAMETEICQIRGQVSKDSHTIERKPSKRIYVVRGETNKNPNDITSRSHMDWRLDKNWKSRSKSRKTRMGNRETETRTRQKNERNLFYWFERRRMQRHHEKMQGESWRRQRQQQYKKTCVRETVVSITEKAKASEANTRFNCMTEAHEPTRQRIESRKGFTKNAMQENGRILYCITI